MGRRIAALVALVVVCSLGGGVAGGALSTERVASEGVADATSTRQLPTVADAPPGSVFAQLVVDSRGSVPVGLVKRGRSGGLVFNPSTERIALASGDVLVDRRGQRYAVETPQRLKGGSGAVGPGARLFAGESGLRFVGFASRSLPGLAGQGAAGDVLDLGRSVPTDQSLGVYRDPDEPSQSVTVQQARVSRLEVLSRNGGTVDPGSTIQPTGFVVVRADVNFLEAERARIAMVDAATNQTVATGILSREAAMARYPDSASVIARLVPPGTAQPEGDGTARSLANPAHQPSTTVYLIQDLAAVRRAGDYRFEAGGDTRGSFGDLARAGVGQSVPIRLDTARPATPPTVDSPSGEYVLGESVAVGGRADPATSVAVYVRTEGGWELLSERFGAVPVGPDGEWAVQSVTLSAESEVLATPGSRTLGVIGVTDADTDGDGTADGTLSVTQFAAGASGQRRLRVVEPRLEPTTTAPTVTVESTTTETTTTSTPTETSASTTPAGTTPGTDGQPVPGFGFRVVLVGFATLLALAVVRSRG